MMYSDMAEALEAAVASLEMAGDRCHEYDCGMPPSELSEGIQAVADAAAAARSVESFSDRLVDVFMELFSRVAEAEDEDEFGTQLGLALEGAVARRDDLPLDALKQISYFITSRGLTLGDKMTMNEYQVLCMRTMPDLPSEELVKMSVMGIVGELGELVEVLKKEIYHGIPGDRLSTEKEFGDVMWYLATLATSINADLGAIAKANIEKLQMRYPGGFESGGGNR